jgi:hypothetical protein
VGVPSDVGHVGHGQSARSSCGGGEGEKEQERTLGLVDIRCGGEAFRSYGEKGGQPSLRWNQIREDQLKRRRSLSESLARSPRPNPTRAWAKLQGGTRRKEENLEETAPLHRPLYTTRISTHKAASRV